MATAPAVVRSRFKWHTRATWSAREDRIPSLVWLALIWFGMVAGFGVDMPRFLHESPPPAAVVDVHAVVFTVWLLLLTAQVLLVVGDRVALHRRLARAKVKSRSDWVSGRTFRDAGNRRWR